MWGDQDQIRETAGDTKGDLDRENNTFIGITKETKRPKTSFDAQKKKIEMSLVLAIDIFTWTPKSNIVIIRLQMFLLQNSKN